MKIERLTLHGFKSFADRVELAFDQGVTGVIGPNGSGKSNVVEAIRFVMGSRARALRAREAEALIFHGGQGKKPMPFAEVELVLRSGRERFVVSRRIDRSGNQVVRLNGKRATFRQIERVLVGSGLGKNAHALVGQGEVSSILESAPDALLERLEEASGLRVVTLSLRETKQRLERAQIHLNELRERHSSRLAEKARLIAEAEEARRAEMLASERLAVQRGLFVARRRALEAEISELKERSRHLEVEREKCESSRVEQNREAELLERDLATAAAELTRLQAHYSALESEKGFLLREQKHLQQSIDRLNAERGQIKSERERLASMQPPRPPQPPGPEGEKLRLDDELKIVESEIARLQEELKAAENEYIKQEINYRNYREELIRFESARETYKAARAERERWMRSLVENTQKLKELEAVYRKVLQRDGLLQNELSNLRDRASRLRAELEAASREADRLEHLVASGSDLSEGPRKLIRWRPKGMLGVVADLLQVPKGMEAAAEAALGARLQWVLMEDENSLRAAVKRLRREGGRATFLSRDLARPRTSDMSAWKGRRGVIGAARELFALRGERKLSDALFGNTLVVESLDVALELAREKSRVRMVTLDGEVIETLGSVSSGSAGRGAGARLGLRRRLRTLSAERKRIDGELQEVLDRIRALEKERSALKVNDLDNNIRQLNAERIAIQRAIESLPRVDEAPPKAPEPVEAPDDSHLNSLRGKLGVLVERREELSARMDAWKEYATHLAAFQVALEHFEERQKSLLALRGREERMAEEYLELKRREAEIVARLEELEGEIAGLGLDSRRENVRNLRARLEKIRSEQQARVEKLAKIAGELEQVRLQLARREATLEEVLREGAELPPGDAAGGTVRKLQLRLREIERELEALGPVNHRAAQALEKLLADMGEVEQTLAEAEEAARRLEEEATGLREIYSERLQLAFDRFRARFAYYGRALLGGMADVRLDEEGLHIMVQPRGKRTRDLRLLSTGEKTMGALGFLFALAEVGEGSLPIAVLDEVDAPLDESNILRFVGFLRDFARDRQFILVTHQKRTMEACDVLWGVTNRGGASLVYGLKREEVS